MLIFLKTNKHSIFSSALCFAGDCPVLCGLLLASMISTHWMTLTHLWFWEWKYFYRFSNTTGKQIPSQLRISRFPVYTKETKTCINNYVSNTKLKEVAFWIQCGLWKRWHQVSDLNSWRTKLPLLGSEKQKIWASSIYQFGPFEFETHSEAWWFKAKPGVKVLIYWMYVSR